MVTLLLGLAGILWWRVARAHRDNQCDWADLAPGWVDRLTADIDRETLLERAYARGDFPLWAREMEG